MVTLAAARPLSALTASNLMSRDVVVIPREMSLRKAAHLLSQARISGGPVVDDEGRCVGVLSATDFVHWAEGEGPAAARSRPRAPCYCAEWEVTGREAVPEGRVCDYMTADPVTAAPSATVPELARMMLDAHVHRVIVVDKGGRPVGVVSSTDLLAAVAYGRTTTA